MAAPLLKSAVARQLLKRAYRPYRQYKQSVPCKPWQGMGTQCYHEFVQAQFESYKSRENKNKLLKLLQHPLSS